MESPKTRRLWTKEEDQCLRDAVSVIGARKWKQIAERVPGRDHIQCIQRWKKALDPSLTKGFWQPHEDKILVELKISTKLSWSQIAKSIPGRCGKQCRERWNNFLDPNLKHTAWTATEDQIVLQGQRIYGNQWSLLSKFMPGRTQTKVRDRWKALNHKARKHQNVSSEGNEEELMEQTAAKVAAAKVLASAAVMASAEAMKNVEEALASENLKQRQSQEPVTANTNEAEKGAASFEHSHSLWGDKKQQFSTPNHITTKIDAKSAVPLKKRRGLKDKSSAPAQQSLIHSHCAVLSEGQQPTLIRQSELSPRPSSPNIDKTVSTASIASSFGDSLLMDNMLSDRVDQASACLLNNAAEDLAPPNRESNQNLSSDPDQPEVTSRLLGSRNYGSMWQYFSPWGHLYTDHELEDMENSADLSPFPW